MSGVIVAVLKALPMNTCPLCGVVHREGTRPVARCAARMEAAGYVGYEFGYERWVKRDDTSDGPRDGEVSPGESSGAGCTGEGRGEAR